MMVTDLPKCQKPGERYSAVCCRSSLPTVPRSHFISCYNFLRKSLLVAVAWIPILHLIRWFLVQVMSWIRCEGEPFLEKQTEIGDSIGHMNSLQEEFDKFDSTAKVSLA